LPDATLERWSALLDELERDVESDGARGGTPWRPPTGLGPIPAQLIERAQAIAAAQQDTITELEDEQRSIRRHLTAMRNLPQHRNETGPLYLDASG
jgi:hypothetical protein